MTEASGQAETSVQATEYASYRGAGPYSGGEDPSAHRSGPGLAPVPPPGVATATPLATGAAGAPDVEATASIGAGQVFADILLLAALACQVPFAVVSVPQPGGQWSTLSHGFDQRVGLNDPRLFDLISSRNGPVELPELASTVGLAGCPLVGPPHDARWAYGAALRGQSGKVLGVVAVLDRAGRDLSRRERRAMLAVTRQMTGHLSQLRKVASPEPGAAPAVAGNGANPLQTRAPAGPSGPRRMPSLSDGQQLLRSHEVAVLFDVTERTVINWAGAGKLPSLRTIGGHLRFRSDDVLGLLAGRSFPARSAGTG